MTRQADEDGRAPLMSDIVRWSPGDVIVVQEVFGARLWAARPVVVVDDVDDHLVLWCPEGTRRKVPVAPPARPDTGTRGERLARSLEHGDLGQLRVGNARCIDRVVCSPGDDHGGRQPLVRSIDFFRKYTY